MELSQSHTTRPRRRHLSDAQIQFLFIAPTIILLVLMNIFPLFYSLYLSFTEFSVIKPNNPPLWVGLQNYQNILRDEETWKYFALTGRYVLLSVVRQDIRFSDPEFHKREATLIASRNARPDDFAEVVAQMRAGRVPTSALNTHRGALADGVRLFQDWSRPEAGVIKAILDL